VQEVILDLLVLQDLQVFKDLLGLQVLMVKMVL
jgi:hypothetical protein